jgi:hypothetical protein
LILGRIIDGEAGAEKTGRIRKRSLGKNQIGSQKMLNGWHIVGKMTANKKNRQKITKPIHIVQTYCRDRE